ncbi:MAG: hypothetical protein MZV63_27510 [Marinilabiliales bacterium]|nr:hypothetical protein [Marinilabiliales bacterium]
MIQATMGAFMHVSVWYRPLETVSGKSSQLKAFLSTGLPWTGVQYMTADHGQ